MATCGSSQRGSTKVRPPIFAPQAAVSPLYFGSRRRAWTRSDVRVRLNPERAAKLFWLGHHLVVAGDGQATAAARQSRGAFLAEGAKAIPTAWRSSRGCRAEAASPPTQMSKRRNTKINARCPKALVPVQNGLKPNSPQPQRIGDHAYGRQRHGSGGDDGGKQNAKDGI